MFNKMFYGGTDICMKYKIDGMQDVVTITLAGNGFGSLVSWAMESWTLTAAGNGFGSLFAWAMKSIGHSQRQVMGLQGCT